jgi:hypothetical protein
MLTWVKDVTFWLNLSVPWAKTLIASKLSDKDSLRVLIIFPLPSSMQV